MRRDMRRYAGSRALLARSARNLRRAVGNAVKGQVRETADLLGAIRGGGPVSEPTVATAISQLERIGILHELIGRTKE